MPRGKRWYPPTPPPPRPAVSVEIGLRASMEELETMPALVREAFLAGVARVISANREVA